MRMPASLVGKRRARFKSPRCVVHSQGGENALTQSGQKAKAGNATSRDGSCGMTGVDIGEATAKWCDGCGVAQARKNIFGGVGRGKTGFHQARTRKSQPVAAQVSKRRLLRDPGVIQLKLRHVPHHRIIPVHQPVGNQGSHRGRNKGLAARANVEACVQGNRVVNPHRLVAPGQVITAVIDHQRDRRARYAQRSQVRVADPSQPRIQRVKWTGLGSVHGDDVQPRVDRSNNWAAGSPRTAQGSSMRGKKSPSRWV